MMIKDRFVYLLFSGAFLMMILLMTVNEFIDLPSKLFQSEPTPVNVYELYIELTMMVCGYLLFLILLYFYLRYRRKLEKALKENIREKEALVRESHHRIKNDLEMLIGLLTTKKRDNPESALMIDEVNRKIHVIAQIHEMICQKINLESVEIKEYFESLTGKLLNLNSLGISSKIESEVDYLNSSQVCYLGILMNELLTNAIKYALPDHHGSEDFVFSVLLHYSETDDNIVLHINYPGLPFQYETDSDRQSAGKDLITLMVKQLKGKIEYHFCGHVEIILSFPRTKKINR